MSGWVEETKGVAPAAKPAASARLNRGVTTETVDRTSRILIRFIGPIAPAVVKRAAPAARDETDLYCRLAERITDAGERERFLTEVRLPH